MNNKLRLIGISLLLCVSAHANPNLFSLLAEGRFEELKTELVLNPERVAETATFGRNLLHVLAQHQDGNTDAVVGLARWLVLGGANVYALDAFEMTPREIALETRNWRLADVFRQETTPSLNYDLDLTQNAFAGRGGFGRSDNPDTFGRFGFVGHSAFTEIVTPSRFDDRESTDERPLKRRRIGDQNGFAALVAEGIAALAAMNSEPAENAPKPVLEESRYDCQNEKENSEEDGDQADEDDDEFVVSRSNDVKEAYGRAYKKAKQPSRNPKPPPTGFQKRKEDLTYKEGPKSSLGAPTGSKQDRRANARKQ